MDIINVDAVESALRRYAAHATYPQVRTWIMTVGRNYILSKLTEKDQVANYRVYVKPAPGKFSDMPAFNRLPDWARIKHKAGIELHWFDTVQIQKRPFWQALDYVISWFNNWAPTDPRLNRLDRQNFNTVAGQAGMWMRDLTANIWAYVKDCPPVVKQYEAGFRWVKLITSLHFEREGHLQSHCVVGSTEVTTDKGVLLIGELCGKTANVLTRTNADRANWVSATFRSFGVAEVWGVVLVNRKVKKTIYATEGHRWFIRGSNANDFQTRFTSELKIGDRLVSIHKDRGPTASWYVGEILPAEREEEVFCAEVPVTHCFVLAGDILVYNCSGNSYYYERFKRGESTYYSLRDKDNNPHVTIEVSDKRGAKGDVIQCKGHGNQKPAPTYQPYIRRFFNDMGWSLTGDRNHVD